MIHPAAIVAVDDKPGELKTIIDALRQLDVACLPVLADGANVDLRAPLKGVRLVFFDINYLSGVVSETAMFEAAATVLMKVVAPDNGPFVLITWSSKSETHDRLMAHLARDVPEAPAPAVTGFLRKERFTAEGVGREGGQALRDEIKSVIASQPQVQALMGWELSAREAAGDVVCSLLELFTREQRFGAGYGDQFQQILSHIGASAVGAENVDMDRRGAMDEALVPILFDRLTHQLPDEDEEAVWTAALGAGAGNARAHGPRLNALSHIARNVGGTAPGDRGVVFAVPEGAGQRMAERVGVDLAAIAADFLNSLPEGRNKPGPPDMADVTARCRWVFIGTRAVCDQAQAKGAMRPVVLALEVPGSLKENGRGLRYNTHGAIELTPRFTLADAADESDRRLVVDWHWTTSFSKAELNTATVLYRIREPLISQLTTQMGVYATRPGIITYD